MNELTIGDKIYVSSKRAAEITGYAKDYIGQLCREGHVEAKMVGRSWYVLETSIREHRFGKQVEKTPESQAETPLVPEVSIPATWEPTIYTAEPVTTIPKIVPAPKAPEPAFIEGDEEEPLSEMQNAWKEWFETRKVAPEAVEEEDEAEIKPEEAVSLPIQRIEEPPIRESIRSRPPEPIVQAHAPAYRPQEPIVKPRKEHNTSAGANIVIVALLVVFAGISIAVAAIGTGYAADYINGNPIIRFIAGTSTVTK